ncbi:hypothetical protein ZWY2020_040714, partial [Hordeum vulgare]
LRAYELKQRQKKLKFGSDSNDYAKKEKHRRAADGAKVSKFAKFKKRPSSVAEEGGTPRRSQDPQRRRQHVIEGPNSSDDDFVLGDFVRDINSTRRKDGFPSKN